MLTSSHGLLAATLAGKHDQRPFCPTRNRRRARSGYSPPAARTRRRPPSPRRSTHAAPYPTSVTDNLSYLPAQFILGLLVIDTFSSSRLLFFAQAIGDFSDVTLYRRPEGPSAGSRGPEALFALPSVSHTALQKFVTTDTHIPLEKCRKGPLHKKLGG